MARTYRWDFFIAHAAADLIPAELLYELLQPFHIFLDQKCLRPGDDWDQEILRAQVESLITVVLVSRNSDEAYYLREELANAVRMARDSKTKHRVVPVLLEELDSQVLYGWRLKHSLHAVGEVQMLEAARSLKALLEHPTLSRQGSRRHSRLYSDDPIRLDRALAIVFKKMGSEVLAKEVVIPLLHILDSGRIDEVFSNNRQGTTLLSFGIDSLRRPRVLCIHIEHLNSPPCLRVATEMLENAKIQGIVGPTGRRYRPDEIWIISPEFPSMADQPDMAATLEELNRRGIKCVPGEELGSLLIDLLPDVATRLSQFSRPEIVTLISTLGRHDEARAFGLTTDRNITDFYITAALAPHAIRAAAALRGEIRFDTHETIQSIPLKDIVSPVDIFLTLGEFRKVLERRAWKAANRGLEKYRLDGLVAVLDEIEELYDEFADSFTLEPESIMLPEILFEKLAAQRDPLSQYLWNRFDTKKLNRLESLGGTATAKNHLGAVLAEMLNGVLSGGSIYYPSLFEGIRLASTPIEMIAREGSLKAQLVVNRLLLEDAYSNCIQKWNPAQHWMIEVEVKWKCGSAFQKLLAETRFAVARCPEALMSNVKDVKRTFAQLQSLEQFIEDVGSKMDIEANIPVSQTDLMPSGPVRIRISEPERLLDLGKLVLIEGPPGCGKTTLLKVLTLSILNKDSNVVYLPCSSIPYKYNTQPLEVIALKCGRGTIANDQLLEQSVLVIDGLDEAPFDLTKQIEMIRGTAKHVIVSCRTAFNTALRSTAFRIGIAPFDHSERDEFYERWFKKDSELLSQIKELIRNYRDIDIHTRLPLIATITAALVQNGVLPKTRAEIYGFRLDLLLSKWDQMRGFRRVHIDNPDAKRRFLRFLAHETHSAESRRRTIRENELRTVFERSFGQWGYHVNFENLVEDLLVANGILIEEAHGIYSLGHLTFQEHLVGEYIDRQYSIANIADLLGEDWWREPLNFYASVKGDITELLEYIMGEAGYITHATQLALMATYAPYTSPGAVEVLKYSAAESSLRDGSKERE